MSQHILEKLYKSTKVNYKTTEIQALRMTISKTTSQFNLLKSRKIKTNFKWRYFLTPYPKISRKQSVEKLCRGEKGKNLRATPLGDENKGRGKELFGNCIVKGKIKQEGKI